MNNISTLNKQLADSSESRFLRERAERVLGRALLVIITDAKSKNNSLSRREESWKKLSACLLVCPQGQKNIFMENIKISIFVLNDD